MGRARDGGRCVRRGVAAAVAVVGGGEHKEDRIISVRVLMRRCPFAGVPVYPDSRLRLLPTTASLASRFDCGRTVCMM